jgi:hypothetical protein
MIVEDKCEEEEDEEEAEEQNLNIIHGINTLI